jgi:CDP-6-deoxy-D-xylo-4-hexulose-3-dehydrase
MSGETFKMIPLMKSTFYHQGRTLRELSDFILSNPRLSMGEQCFAFEKEFAKKQEREYATLMNSGGSANLALLQALKNLRWLNEGDGVAFSAVTWSTNVMPIIQMELTPIPVDVQPNTLNSMSRQFEETLEKSTVPIKAFFITNALGFCGDLKAIQDICRANKIILLEDNCEALGTRTAHGLAGSFGLASTYSFYVAHHISTIEGGMVCTDNPLLDEMLKIVRSQGWGRNLPDKIRKVYQAKHKVSNFNEKYTFYDLGFNFKPTEITGFLGKVQLKYLDEIVAKRQENYRKVAAVIEKNPEFIPTTTALLNTISCFGIPVVCTCPELREWYLEEFTAAGVETRPMIAGNILNQPFYKQYGYSPRGLTGAEFLDKCAFYCGNCPEYSEDEINTIVKCCTKK